MQIKVERAPGKMKETNSNTQPAFTPETIDDLIRGLTPIDWVQVQLTAQLSPAERVLAGMRAQAFAKAALRGAFKQRFPDLSNSELNMKVLAYLTPVRMDRNNNVGKIGLQCPKSSAAL
jgi:hypothetical protein